MAPFVCETTYNVPRTEASISVTIPNPDPIMRLSLSVKSNLAVLSATRSDSLGSLNTKLWRLDARSNLNRYPGPVGGPTTPTKRSPDMSGPNVGGAKAIPTGSAAYFQLNSGSLNIEPGRAKSRERASAGVFASRSGGHRNCCNPPGSESSMALY